jgi:membrane fusion protein, multidrug efflux system
MRLEQLLHSSLLALLLLPSSALPQDGSGIPVEVATATMADLAQVVQLTGTVTARHAAPLSVSTSGLVVELGVDAGDRVDQGDVLLQLDSELATHQYNSARAEQSQAERALEDARRRLEEARRLAPQRSIAETVVRDLEAEVAEDGAALEKARANSGYSKGILDRHQLRAPFPGVISSRSVDLGQWVTPGQSVLMLVSAEQLRLDFQVPEDHLGRISEGAPVEFSLGANRQERHGGTVLTTVPVTDPAVRTFLLRVQPDQTIPGMLPGMSARAQFRMDTGRRGIAIPRDAVLRYSDGRVIVWVIHDKNGKQTATERRVTAGLSFGGLVEISTGLSEGERVVVKGNEALRSGQAVTILGED